MNRQNVVVVAAHPNPTSYNAAVARAVVDGLRQRGHEVRLHDLTADDFAAYMSREERHAYHGEMPVIDPVVRRYADDIDWATALVFVYPTWWMNLPAVLKAWLERVMVPGVAFTFDAKGKVTSNLTKVGHIVGVTTYGAKRGTVFFASDGGRRTLMRALRLSCGMRTRTHWFALYDMDHTNDERRKQFLDHVSKRVLE